MEQGGRSYRRHEGDTERSTGSTRRYELIGKGLVSRFNQFRDLASFHARLAIKKVQGKLRQGFLSTAELDNSLFGDVLNSDVFLYGYTPAITAC